MSCGSSCWRTLPLDLVSQRIRSNRKQREGRCFVIPAEAGIQAWTPAFAGVTHQVRASDPLHREAGEG